VQERLRFEAESLLAMHAVCPAHVVELYDYDAPMATLAMQYLPPPHAVVRHGLLQGHVYPDLAAHAAEQLATTLFHTSAFALDGAAFRAQADRFTNAEMCALTEQVIFTDPYYDAPHNRHTSPQLDELAAALKADTDMKRAAALAKAKFVEQRQALLHGDLHTGSCMAADDSYFVFDTEFAFYGPMAFDIGKLMANVLLMFFALDGHATAAAPRSHQRAYLLQVRASRLNCLLIPNHARRSSLLRQHIVVAGASVRW
jgi:5-methylthioribose kinase